MAVTTAVFITFAKCLSYTQGTLGVTAFTQKAGPTQGELELLAVFYYFNHDTKISCRNAFWERMRCFKYIRHAVCYFYGFVILKI